MNPITELLQDLQRLGVTVRADRDLIRFAPKSAVGPDLLERMRRHKAELLAMLRGRARPSVGPIPLTASEFTVTDKKYLAPTDLPQRWQEYFQERAAVREFEGNQSREHAEMAALAETMAAMERGDAP
ncbi:MAG: hypothetical protein HOP29_10440 [Phycisphaerales bacterium]|nr:hypothetical protein [Phycisphaerales bacterium]